MRQQLESDLQKNRKAGVWNSSWMRHLQTILVIFADKSCIYISRFFYYDQNYVKKWNLAGILQSGVPGFLHGWNLLLFLDSGFYINTSVGDPDPVFLGHPDPDPVSTTIPIYFNYLVI